MNITGNGRLFLKRRTWICKQCSYSTRGLTEALQNQIFRNVMQRGSLPKSPARTRFAPSPTGYLHLGSLRTALYNFLLAKATNGQFIIRIEDTDQKRTIADAEERIYHDLKWAGLQWDEGPDIGGPRGPYKQSERTRIYQTHAEWLLNSGHAYRCFGEPDSLDHTTALNVRCCSEISRDESEERACRIEPYVIRLKLPARDLAFKDLVYGYVNDRSTQRRPMNRSPVPCFSDPVLLKSDGFPTYHLANVVDDHYMGITHVIRAAEWMSSTSKHAYMYEAFDWSPPSFAHVGLLQDAERQKYSKRSGGSDFDIHALRESGILPEALLNYVVLHGWSHGRQDDFMRMQDMIKNFDLNFTKGNTIITADKLKYIQKRHLEKIVEEGGGEFQRMVDSTSDAVENLSRSTKRPLELSRPQITARVSSLIKRDTAHSLPPDDFAQQMSGFFFHESRTQLQFDTASPVFFQNLHILKDSFASVSEADWTIDKIRDATTEAMDHLIKLEMDSGSEENAMPFKDARKSTARSLNHFLRWAIIFGNKGPGMAQTMEVLGRDESLSRLDDGITSLQHPLTDQAGSATG